MCFQNSSDLSFRRTTCLFVPLLEALQVRAETIMTRKCLCQVEVKLTVFSLLPGGKLRDQTMCLSPCRLSMPSYLTSFDEPASSLLVDSYLHESVFLFVETVRYAEMIPSVIPLCAEESCLKKAWLSRANAHTGAAYSSFECTTLATSFLFASLSPSILRTRQAKLVPH